MHQVSGALVAIVLVLCSVFIPVALVGGDHWSDVQAVRDDDRDLGRPLGHRRAHAHSRALRHPAPEAAGGNRQSFLRRVQSRLRPRDASICRRSRPNHRWTQAVVRRLHRPCRCARHPLASRAEQLPSDRRQGLLRDLGAIAGRCLAAAHPGGRRAHRGDATQGAGGQEHRRARGIGYHLTGLADELGDDVRQSQAVVGARIIRRRRCNSATR